MLCERSESSTASFPLSMLSPRMWVLPPGPYRANVGGRRRKPCKSTLGSRGSVSSGWEWTSIPDELLSFFSCRLAVLSLVLCPPSCFWSEHSEPTVSLHRWNSSVWLVVCLRVELSSERSSPSSASCFSSSGESKVMTGILMWHSPASFWAL